MTAMLPVVGGTAGACKLWQEELFCDYTIEVENKEFKVHKVIMASVSEYFKVMLQGSMAESQSSKVRIRGFSSLAVKNTIELIYTGQFGSVQADAQELLAFADYLVFPAGIEACTKLLVNKLDPENCLDIISCFKTYSVMAGVDQVIKYIKANFDEIVQNFVPHRITFDELLILTEHWQKREFDLFNSIKQWIDIDYENRQTHTDKLMRQLRFGLMTTEQLAAIKETDIYRVSGAGWCELVQKGEEYHKQPIHQKVLDKSETSRVRDDPLAWLYLNKGSKVMSLQDDMTWKQHGVSPTPQSEIPKLENWHREVVVNNFLIVSVKQECYIFDPRSLQWHRMASMAVPRSNYALVDHENHLYALGGHTGYDPTRRHKNLIDKYDFVTNSWTEVPSNLPMALSFHHAGVIENSIYITGHMAKERLYCYDINNNEWHSKAPPLPCLLNSPIVKMYVMELWHEEVLFFLDEGFQMRYYSPSEDMWSRLNCLAIVKTQLKWDVFNPLYIGPIKNTIILQDCCYHVKAGEGDRGSAEKLGGCVKWVFNAAEKDITEVGLHLSPYFPLENERKGCCIFAMPRYNRS